MRHSNDPALAREIPGQDLIRHDPEGDEDRVRSAQVAQLLPEELHVLLFERGIFSQVTHHFSGSLLVEVLDDVRHVRAPERRTPQRVPDLEVHRLGPRVVEVSQRGLDTSARHVQSDKDDLGLQLLEEPRVGLEVEDAQVAHVVLRPLPLVGPDRPA